ncbi:DNA-binding transcription factor [Pseudogymnoascus australis]
MASEYFRGDTSWIMYRPYIYPPQPQTLWDNEAPPQMYGLNNYPTQPQTPWDNEALRQVSKWPPQPTIAPFMCKGASHPNIGQALENPALCAEMQGIQVTWSAIEAGPRTFASVGNDKSFEQSSEAIATAGWGKPPGEHRQSQTQTREVAQSTAVDALMRAIQAKPAGDGSIKAAAGEKRAHAQEAGAEGETDRGGSGASANAGEYPMKPYKCRIGGCPKAFFQKTQLKVHIRAHTEVHLPPCPHAFSQLGNLKAHLRRHTGERPFACPTCGKTFAQRDNLRIHAAVHKDGGATKKYACRLDGCGTGFTKLGNLKSHMNKFHIETLKGLTARFWESEAKEGGKEGGEDELLEYFRSLYRNANKGIKGRGKGRRVAPIHNTGSMATFPPSLSSSTSSLSSLTSLPLSPLSSTSSYTDGIPAHFNIRMGAGMEMEMLGGGLCASCLGSLYGVGTYKEDGGGLAFGDRMCH